MTMIIKKENTQLLYITMVLRFLKSINHLKNCQVFGGSFIKTNDSLKLFFPPPPKYVDKCDILFYFQIFHNAKI